MSGGNATNLLRLLEPAVRPGNLPRAASPVSAPIEARSFDSILEEAQSLNVEGQPTAGATENGEPGAKPAAAGKGPLASLARIDCVENAALRDMLAKGDTTRVKASNESGGG